MNFFNRNSNQLMQQIFGGAPQTQMQMPMPNISEDQFFSFTSTLDKKALNQLVNQARAKGISDKDIQSGLNIILQHR